MSYSVKGKLKRVGEVQTIKDFTKRTFVIETGEQYPQSLEFQLTKDRVDIIEVYKLGNEIEVHFNLRGRDWTNPQGEIKTFNQLECWKIVPINVNTVEESPAEDYLGGNDFQNQATNGSDLPF